MDLLSSLASSLADFLFTEEGYRAPESAIEGAVISMREEGLGASETFWVVEYALILVGGCPDLLAFARGYIFG